MSSAAASAAASRGTNFAHAMRTEKRGAAALQLCLRKKPFLEQCSTVRHQRRIPISGFVSSSSTQTDIPSGSVDATVQKLRAAVQENGTAPRSTSQDGACCHRHEGKMKQALQRDTRSEEQLRHAAARLRPAAAARVSAPAVLPPVVKEIEMEADAPVGAAPAHLCSLPSWIRN